MAYRRDADISQVAGCQPGEQLGVDVVVAERLIVLPQAQSMQPSPDVHNHCPRSGTLALSEQPTMS